MKRSPSLALRLVAYLVAAQLIAVVIGWVVATGLDAYGFVNFNAYFDGLSYARIRDLVIGSLVRGDDGLPRLEPAPELRAELDRNGSLKFAVFDIERNQPVRGSAPELIQVFAENRSVKVIVMSFAWADESGYVPKGYQEFTDRPFGPMRVALYGSSLDGMTSFECLALP